MRLFNTLTRQKEELTVRDGRVRMYACGPTVYNYIHIGNARCFVLFDLLRRYLEYRGNEVVFVQNFTDVDDKMIAKAKAEGCTVPEIAARYIDAYFTDAQGLGVRPATVHPRATENIPEIIEIVQTLIDKGHAYESNGNVYFAAGSFPHYGCLSHYNLDELEAGARIDVNDEKRHPFDFALWKAKKEEGEISWPSPWGEGRPGWHIECSAMVRKYLGTDIDIHCGGQDLTFPHHENEIAQSEAANGCEFAHYWVHNGYINVDNQKMSKSLGNFFTVRDVAQAYGYEVIRFFMLSSHYRSQINYSTETLEQAKAALERLYNCKNNLQFLCEKGAAGEMTEAEQVAAGNFAKHKQAFLDAMDDDLNTADAISAIFELVREINTVTGEQEAPTQAFARAALDIFEELCSVLGICQGKTEQLDDEVEALIEQRQAARKAKDFKTADAIRDKLHDMGIVLEDTPQGVKWRRA